MSDPITPQSFRDAIKIAPEWMHPLLLAAAEQAEALAVERATIERALTYLSDVPETEDRAYNEGWLDAGMTVTGILLKGGQ